MAVRFSKLKTINLADDDQEEELDPTGEKEPEEIGDEGDMNAIDGPGDIDDEGKTKLIMDEDEDEAEVKGGRVPRWMFWRSRGSYSPPKQRRWRRCPCNSWKVIAIAVLTFSVVFLISLIISTLVPEPSEGEEQK